MRLSSAPDAIDDSFAGSYSEDGTIFGLPDVGTQLEVVRAHATIHQPDRFDQLVFYLPDAAAMMAATAPLRNHGLAPDSAPHPYWEANGAVVYLDPDGRALVYGPMDLRPRPRPSRPLAVTAEQQAHRLRQVNPTLISASRDAYGDGTGGPLPRP